MRMYLYLGKFGHIGDTGLDLGEEGRDLLELLEPEQGVAGGVLEQDEVGSHVDTRTRV